MRHAGPPQGRMPERAARTLSSEPAGFAEDEFPLGGTGRRP